MVRPVLGLRGRPAFAPRGRLAVATPAHDRVLRVDGTGTIHCPGLVAALVVDGGPVGAWALEAGALGALALGAARERRPSRTCGRRATSHAPWCRPLGARAEAFAPILARP